MKSGEISKDHSKEINKAAETIDNAFKDAKKSVADLIRKLENANTLDEIKEAVREATKTNLETMVKAGQMTKGQADQMLLTAATGMSNLTEELLRAQVQQMKTAMEQMK